jgi:shikimate dehydrogenase
MSQYGLIGEKLGHSFSPAIHKQLWGADYELMPTPRDQIDAFFRDRNFSGINVTIPYKQIACAACEHVDPKAQAIGAVNTVVNRNGELYGYNTDYDGFLYCARRAGICFTGKKVLILGSGGTSLTARTAVADAGASEIVIISRSLPADQGEAAASPVQAGITHKCPLSYDTYSNLALLHRDAQVIVNTTPVGMFPNNYASPVDISLFPQLSGVIDVIFNPGTTMLVYQAKKSGIPATCGLPMLVAQAAYAATHFTGRTFTEEEIETVYRSIHCETTNLVLIGMPGCGKTTMGKKLAAQLKRELVDIDAMIVEQEGRSIPDIFAQDGEEYFRTRETEAVKEAGKRTGVIISCGGGLPMREENHYPLQQNGRIYFLNRKLDCLATGGRPLSANRNDLPQMYERRCPVYRSLCDCELSVIEGNPYRAVKKILEDFHENTGH